MTETTKTKIFQDGIKVETTPVQTKPQTKVAVTRHISSEMIGKEIASRVMGTILLDVEDLYNPKTQQFLTESELKAKGAIFLTADFHKVLTFENGGTVKKGRTTKNPIPYILKTFKTKIIANIDWSKYINRRNGDVEFVAKEHRQNGVCNFENCKAIGQTKKGFFTINGVLFRSLESVKFTDENGNEYTDIKGLKNEYFKKTYDAEQKGKQKEADKHGIELKFDPQYRTVRIDNCKSVNCFGFHWKPTDNINNQ